MKASLPWLRAANVKNRSNAHSDTRFFRVDREFEFKEFLGNEAPIAFRWLDIEIRLLKDRLFRRVFLKNGENRSRGWEEPSLSPDVDRVLSRSATLNLLQSSSKLRYMTDGYINIDRARMSSNALSDYKYVDWDFEELQEDCISEWLDDVVLIDGEFWIACPCPSYSVRYGNVFPVTSNYKKREKRSAADLRLGDIHRTKRPFDNSRADTSMCEVFSIWEFEAAKQFASETRNIVRNRDEYHSKHRERLVENPAPSSAIEIEVILEHCIDTTEWSGLALLEATDRLWDDIATDGFGSSRDYKGHDRSALFGIAELQGVCHGVNPDDVDADDLADAIDLALPLLLASETAKLTKWTQAALSTSVSRVRNRRISLPM